MFQQCKQVGVQLSIKIHLFYPRKHQLRKQLLIHGNPVLGDSKYRISEKRNKDNSLMLHAYKISSYRDNKNIGIWVGNKKNSMKIAAIGIKVKKWIAYHGFALNVSNDLSKYKGIIPCGIKDKSITNLKELGVINFSNIDKIIIKKFLNIFL